MARKHRKFVKPLVISGGAVALVGMGVVYTALSYATAAGDRTLWSVRLMERTGLEQRLAQFTARRAQKKTQD